MQKQKLCAMFAILIAMAVGLGGLGSTVLPHGLTMRAPRHYPMIVHERHGKNLVDSTNWSGYAVTGGNGSVSDVRGSWIVPSANCSNSPSTSYASFWVGIDGYSSNTVEQIGTDSDCESGQPTYYVWFEFYPHWSYTVNSVPIKSGDKVGFGPNPVEK
jgi:hypothetical protein